MKKKYSTPYLIVESFQLDTAIANCSSEGGVAIGKYLSNCMMDFYFASYCSDNGGADVTDPDDENDKICYHESLGGAIFLAS